VSPAATSKRKGATDIGRRVIAVMAPIMAPVPGGDHEVESAVERGHGPTHPALPMATIGIRRALGVRPDEEDRLAPVATITDRVRRDDMS
jgi:hypothetical protein